MDTDKTSVEICVHLWLKNLGVSAVKPVAASLRADFSFAFLSAIF
jgi:hypothetical protein